MAIAPVTLPLPRGKWVSLNAAALTGKVTYQAGEKTQMHVRPSATADLPADAQGALFYWPGGGVSGMAIADIWAGCTLQYLHAFSEAGGEIIFAAE
jgi:hypothetical protein